MCFNTMWSSATQQTWIQLCVFTFMYSFLGSRYVQSNEYYIRRGHKNPGDDYLYLEQDVFGYPKRSNHCSGPESFYSQPFVPKVSWPWNVTLCTYRCGTYSSGIGANTFLPKEEKCLNNTEVRTLLNGCMTLFAYEGSMSSPLFVLDINDGLKFQELENSKLKETCKIVGQQYYTSNGTWENIPANCITFLIMQKKLTWVSMNATLYMGRIIKLELKDCKKGNWPVNANECIVFKAQGNFHYRTVVTTTVKLEPSPTPSISHQRSLHTTMPLITSTSYVKVSYTYSSTSPNVTTMALPPLIPSTSEQVSVVTTTNNTTTTSVTTMALPPLIPSTSEQVSVVMTATTSAHIEGPTTPYSKGGSSDQRSSNLENVIIGVVTTCVIVIIICLLVAVLYKRRSNDKNRRSSKAANTSANNPSYEQNKNQIIPLSSTQKRPQDNEDYDNVEYDYAAVDGVQVHTNKEQPVYQSIDRGADQKVSQIYQSLANNPHLKNPDNADSKEYSYNHLQHPTYNPPHPKDTSGSLYNSLQKPGGDYEYQEPETQNIDNPTGASEPVYNVLEGPDAPDANPAPQDNDPVYNVLEDPNTNQFPQDNEPVYNVLEDPHDDYDNAPIDDDQNIPASGQDNVAYSSTIDLNIPQSPSSPDYDVLEDPEGALPDSTYQPLSIRVQDDVYQTLDRASQSIYQTLEPNDSKA